MELVGSNRNITEGEKIIYGKIEEIATQRVHEACESMNASPIDMQLVIDKVDGDCSLNFEASVTFTSEFFAKTVYGTSTSNFKFTIGAEAE